MPFHPRNIAEIAPFTWTNIASIYTHRSTYTHPYMYECMGYLYLGSQFKRYHLQQAHFTPSEDAVYFCFQYLALLNTILFATQYFNAIVTLLILSLGATYLENKNFALVCHQHLL